MNFQKGLVMQPFSRANDNRAFMKEILDWLLWQIHGTTCLTASFALHQSCSPTIADELRHPHPRLVSRTFSAMWQQRTAAQRADTLATAAMPDAMFKFVELLLPCVSRLGVEGWLQVLAFRWYLVPWASVICCYTQNSWILMISHDINMCKYIYIAICVHMYIIW